MDSNMKCAILHVDKAYRENEIFNIDSKLNRDNCLAFYRTLKYSLRRIGFDLNTQDVGDIKDAKIVIFIDIPRNKQIINNYNKQKKIVLLYESEVIKPWNWDIDRHIDFDIVFTWNDQFVDNEKYFKFNFSHENLIDFKNSKRDNYKYDLVLFCGNHRSDHPKSMYNKRKSLIDYFEKSQTQINFKFWGAGWHEEYILPDFNLKVLKKVYKFFNLKTRKYKNHNGYADSKFKILKESRFNFCIENATGYSGYITEKIIDTFKVGCIPIYIGPPNVDCYIPRECYVCYSDFEDVQALVSFIEKIDEEWMVEKREKILDFLKSDAAKNFSDEVNVKKMVNVIEKII